MVLEVPKHTVHSVLTLQSRFASNRLRTFSSFQLGLSRLADGYSNQVTKFRGITHNVTEHKRQLKAVMTCALDDAVGQKADQDAVDIRERFAQVEHPLH